MFDNTVDERNAAPVDTLFIPVNLQGLSTKRLGQKSICTVVIVIHRVFDNSIKNILHETEYKIYQMFTVNTKLIITIIYIYIEVS